jgi:hypothetical protein
MTEGNVSRGLRLFQADIILKNNANILDQTLTKMSQFDKNVTNITKYF